MTKRYIRTAEDAARVSGTTRVHREELLATLAELRRTAWAEPYLTHPDLIVGILRGMTAAQVRTRVEDLADADSGDALDEDEDQGVDADSLIYDLTRWVRGSLRAQREL